MRLTEFLAPFYPDEHEPICIFWVDPDRTRFFGSWRPVSRYELATDVEIQRQWIDRNKEYGLFFTVNAGGSHIADITRTSAVFCERDEGSFEEQHDYIDRCPIQPSIRVETFKSVHCYWLLEENIPLDQWKIIQCGLIDYFRADKALKNANRIMRLPLFNHVRLVEGALSYKPVKIHTFETTAHSTADLMKAFPWSPPPKPKYRETSGADSWLQMKQTLAFRISQDPSYRLESNKRWGTCRGVCHDGRGPSGLAVNWEDMYVHCQKGCSFETIASAFGVSMPEQTSWATRITRRAGESATYQWLKTYKEQNEATKAT